MTVLYRIDIIQRMKTYVILLEFLPNYFIFQKNYNQLWVGVHDYYHWSDDTDLWLLLDGQEFVMTTDHVGRHIQWHVAKAPCDDSYDLEFLAGRAIS